MSWIHAQFITNLQNRLLRTIKANTKLALKLRSDPKYLEVDAIQIDHLLINPAVSAADYLQESGRLTR